MAAKNRSGFFQAQKFTDSLSALIDALPSDANKQKAILQLETLIEFLREVKARVEKLPTQQDVAGTRTTIDELNSFFSDAKNNPLLAAVLGVEIKPPRKKSLSATPEDVERARSTINRFESLPIDQIRSALEQMSARELQLVANSLGLRATQHTARESLTHQVATKITNARGYRNLRDGKNES